MTLTLTLVFSLLTAVTNATSAVLQWHAAAQVPEEDASGLRLARTLLHRPVYLAAVGTLTLSFLLQAAALSQGELAIVQPLLVTELPFTLLIAAVWFRIGVDRRELIGTAAVCVGLGVFLGVAQPHGGADTAPAATWLEAALATAAVMAALVVVARRLGPMGRTVSYALASGVGFALTAVLVKATTARASGGAVHLLAGWEPWAMVTAGAASVLLTQYAMHAGLLAAAKPATTIVNPLVSVALGLTVFHEALADGGAAIMIEVAAAGALTLGILELCRSPLVGGHTAEAGERRDQRRAPGGRRGGRAAGGPGGRRGRAADRPGGHRGGRARRRRDPPACGRATTGAGSTRRRPG